MIGEVIEIEIDYGCGLDTYLTISNDKDNLDDILEEFEGKTVKIMVEEISIKK